MKKERSNRCVQKIGRVLPSVLFVLFFNLCFPLAAETPLYPSNGIGFSYSLEGNQQFMQPVTDGSITKENPLFQRIFADRARVVPNENDFDWNELDSLIATFSSSGYRIIVDLIDSSFEYPAGDESGKDFEKYVEKWLVFVKAAASRYKEKVSSFEIWDSPDLDRESKNALDVQEYAYLLKNSSIKIRAEVRDPIIQMGAIDVKNAQWLQSLYAHEVAMYIDAILLHYKRSDPIDETYAAIQKTIFENDPSSKIWLLEEWDTTPPSPADLVRSIVSARERNSGLILFSLVSPQIIDPASRRALFRCHALFTPSYSKSYEEKKTVEFFSESGEKLTMRYSRYFSLEDFIMIIAFQPDGPAQELPDKAKVRIAERDLRVAAFYDPEDKVWGRIVRFERLPSEKGEKTIFEATIPLKSCPLFIQYKKGGSAPGSGDIDETLQVSGKRLISAEEIIAQHQVFHSAQDERLSNYTALGNVDFHFKMGGSGGTFDVSIANNFFWDREQGAEWEQTEYFVNGNRLNWKKIPEIPLVQPEKVVVLPLDIHLDKNYKYEYAGEDRVEGLDCYVLEFNPVQGELRMYKGKVWIDQKTYAIVKLYTVQTGVKAPIISSEEMTFYEPVTGSDGIDYWLMKRLEGQQIFSAGGRNFVVLREVKFSGFDINSEKFKEKQTSAYDSDHQILKDTDKGFRYYSKNDSGERVIKEDVDTNQLLAIGGVYKDNSFDNPVPLAGVNYFDYNFKKKGIQMNLFFAGILATLNVTDADFLKSKFDFGLDFIGVGIKREDRLFERGAEIEDKNVKYLNQYLGINLGYPFADFFKLRTTVNVDFTLFSRSDKTLSSFVIPSDTVVYGVGLTGEVNKFGYGVQAGTSYHRRSAWEPWGLKDPVTGAFTEYDPDHKDFIRYFLSASKEFYFPYFQKLRFEEEWMSGNDLDRFSKYNIGYFVTRVRGFGGSGVRYDTGSITRGQYSFNLFKVIRFDAQLDYAVVKDKQFSPDNLAFMGAGISANFVGPWKTIIALDYGCAVRSDITELEGSHEFLIVVFKLF